MMSKPGDDVQEDRKGSSDIWNYMMYNIITNWKRWKWIHKLIPRIYWNIMLIIGLGR